MNDLISKSKLDMLNEHINILKREGKISKSDVREYEASLKNKVLSDSIISEKLNEMRKTDSSLVNKSTSDLYFDLYTSFKVNDEITNLTDKYISVSLSTINNINSQLDSYIVKLKDLEQILMAKGNPVLVTENFTDNSSFDYDDDLYTERYGECIPNNRHVKYEFKNARISLPILLEYNTFVYDNGARFATANVINHSGTGFINTNTNTDINNILDNSFKNYWKKTIFSDMPFVVELGCNINSGAALELEVCYESVSVVNKIEINSCTKYPMKLVAIRYSDTDDIKSDMKEIIFPDNPNEFLRSKVIDKSIVYNFKDIVCKRIFFVFNQINYEKKDFIINVNNVVKNDIWMNSYNENKNYFSNENIIFKPNYLNREVTSDYFNKLNSFTLKSENINLYELFYTDKEEYKHIYKNSYEFGFYNILASYLNYDKLGVYVSKPIKANRIINNVSIITEEDHYKSVDGIIDTDIEYYISTSKSPTYRNWIPILPKNKNIIDSELLQLEDDTCILRFPVKNIYDIYMNEVKLKENEDYILRDLENDRLSIEIPGFNHNATYKCSYEPTEEAYKVKLLDTNNMPTTVPTMDVIYANNDIIYELSDIPYIDNEDKTFVRLVDANTGQVLYQDNYNLYCCTDLIDRDQSYKNFFDSDKLKYQYYTYENKIVFNRPVPHDIKIEVSYKNYLSEFRLKAIMRRNNNKDTWLTPVLNKIEYLITTI